VQPEEYRDFLLKSIRVLLRGLSPHPGGLQEVYPFRLDRCDADHLNDLLLQARAVVQRAGIVALAPEPQAVQAARGDAILQDLLEAARAALPTSSNHQA